MTAQPPAETQSMAQMPWILTSPFPYLEEYSEHPEDRLLEQYRIEDCTGQNLAEFVLCSHHVDVIWNFVIPRIDKNPWPTVEQLYDYLTNRVQAWMDNHGMLPASWDPFNPPQKVVDCLIELGPEKMIFRTRGPIDLHKGLTIVDGIKCPLRPPREIPDLVASTLVTLAMNVPTRINVLVKIPNHWERVDPEGYKDFVANWDLFHLENIRPPGYWDNLISEVLGPPQENPFPHPYSSTPAARQIMHLPVPDNQVLPSNCRPSSPSMGIMRSDTPTLIDLTSPTFQPQGLGITLGSPSTIQDSSQTPPQRPEGQGRSTECSFGSRTPEIVEQARDMADAETGQMGRQESLVPSFRKTRTRQGSQSSSGQSVAGSEYWRRRFEMDHGGLKMG